MAQWWFHLLMVGSASLVVPTLVLLTCLRWGWTAFAEDFPEDVQALLLEPTRAEQVARHLDGLLGDANAMSRFVDERPGLLPFRAPR